MQGKARRGVVCVEAMQGKARRDTGSVQCVWRLCKGRLEVEGTQAVCVEVMQGKTRRDTGSAQCVWRLEGTQVVCSVCGG